MLLLIARKLDLLDGDRKQALLSDALAHLDGKMDYQRWGAFGLSSIPRRMYSNSTCLLRQPKD